ncbi:hypothetical protein V494_00899 [Pseudogymnoascus sp. VKM F-4513 (FW-928)]|nr:hypothetical protein V494_00899 [Pseudogymnoascus sp. VKM F-4513 (FW-928)]
MVSLKDTSISPIQPVPGLFISDRFAARAVPLLRSLNIHYILSVTQAENVPKFNTQDITESGTSDTKAAFVQKHLDINDDPTEDILIHLKDTCDWIKASLASAPVNSDGDGPRQAGVLVHCTQGISRSGSIVVAYLMRELSLDYPAALALARESRDLITPNQGFEKQLRIWGQCKYDIFIHEPGSANTREKYGYKAWKYGRDNLMERGEEEVNRTRVASAASLAASFGKRRLQLIEKAQGKKGEEETDGEQPASVNYPWIVLEDGDRQHNLDPVECGYLYRKDPIPINLDKYAALYHNHDDFDSNSTVLTKDIKAEFTPSGRRSRRLYAIVIPISRILIIQENHVFLGNPWERKKYDLYKPSSSYTWTVGVSNPNTHDPNLLSEQLGYRYHGKVDTKNGNIQEFLEAYKSGTCTGVVVDLGRRFVSDTKYVWRDHLESPSDGKSRKKSSKN